MSAERDIAGLCRDCEHSRVVTSARGSRFFLCRLSETDARFVKYPPLPVLRCDGHRPLAAGKDAGRRAKRSESSQRLFIDEA